MDLAYKEGHLGQFIPTGTPTDFERELLKIAIKMGC